MRPQRPVCVPGVIRLMSSVNPSGPAVLKARYEKLRWLGQGGAGAVFLARDLDTGTCIALKQLLNVDPKRWR